MMTTVQAAAFWADHPPDPAWVRHYAASESQPHRAIVLEELAKLPPWTSLYEAGCHCGPMLHAIQQAHPTALLGGCDVNAEAIEACRRWLPFVTVGAFPAATAAMPDQCVDVVLSCYTLAYISPDDLPTALDEAARIARVAVVVCEPMAWHGRGWHREDGAFGEWMHDYLHVMGHSQAYTGWDAHIRRLSFASNALSGIISAVRP